MVVAVLLLVLLLLLLAAAEAPAVWMRHRRCPVLWRPRVLLPVEGTLHLGSFRQRPLPSSSMLLLMLLLRVCLPR